MNHDTLIVYRKVGKTEDSGGRMEIRNFNEKESIIIILNWKKLILVKSLLFIL
jgi:hypothetical protein